MPISVIVPIAMEDDAWKKLIPDLCSLRADDEVIFVTADSSPVKGRLIESLPCSYSIARSEIGRAKQLNLGAKMAQSEFLWFLHCDSRFSKAAFEALVDAISREPDTLHYFDLKFSNDGPPLMRINEMGVWFRSRVFQLPFGDQGFAMSKEIFKRLGRFKESAPYGEDHLLIWRAHQLGIKVGAIGAPLFTSARKYRISGWGKTTARHLKLTAMQAVPELAQLLRMRVRE